MIVRLLTASLTLLAASCSTIISVTREEQGGWQVVSGEAETWVAMANMTDRRGEEGWLHLDVTTNPSQPDEDQAVAAGLAEGFLSQRIITEYYKLFIDKPFCQVDPAFCVFIRKQFRTNLDWMTARVEAEGQSSSYWKMVNLFHKQLYGLKLGWLKRVSDENLRIPADFDLNWFAYFINFYPDIGDYIVKYKKWRQTSQPASQPSLVFSSPSCSVLIKKVGQEVFIGHATWHVYESLDYRVVKRYNLNYHQVTGDLVPGHTIAMSSYAGILYSMDDFYSVSSGLASLETTLFVYNSSLLEQNSPVGQLWEPVRVMVANRLATGGQHWAQLFSRFNSGTYNNQWMVLDYNKVRAGHTRDLLWLTEQLPGKIVSRDVTGVLERQQYWASYNRAYFPEIFRLSGGEKMRAEHGAWFSYDQTPRAVLLSRGQEKVRDEQSLLGLLRSNNFQRSGQSTPQGCTGPIPAAAISARSDLQPSNTTCSWQSQDFMVGRRAYGATDAKVMSSSSARTLSFLAVLGPTTAGGNLPPFSWQTSGFDPPNYTVTNTFQFPSVEIIWNNQFGASSSNFQEEPSKSNTRECCVFTLIMSIFVHIFILTNIYPE